MTTRLWAVTTGGTFDFNNGANWTFGVAPDATDIAQFNASDVTTSDTITGNATVAEILVNEGQYSLAGTYTISGLQATELSLAESSGSPGLTILPGASIIGNQAVSVSGVDGGAALNVQGALVAGSMSIFSATVTVDPGAVFAVTGPITMSADAELCARADMASGQAAVTIPNAIQVLNGGFLGAFGQQTIVFSGIISGGQVLMNSDGIFADTIVLTGNNTYSGGTTIDSANLTVEAGNANAFGTGTLTISGGELLGTTTETIANQLAITAGTTFAAAHGQTLTIGAGSWSFTPSSGEAITFGAPGQDGTVVFEQAGSATINPGAYTVVVQAGTLKGGDLGLLSLVNNASGGVNVQAGATLDLNGIALRIFGLQGGGLVTDSSAANTLNLSGGNFSGVIAGPLAVTVSASTTLSGNNTYFEPTTINSGVTLTLGAGGTTGSLASAVTDTGALAIDRSDAITLTNMSGSGGLVQQGSGTTTLGSGINYSGGTVITNGTLAVGNPVALGGGNLVINGGALLGTTTETVSAPGAVALDGNSTVAAAHGQTLTMDPSQLFFDATSITIGAAGQDGTVEFKESAFIGANPGYSVTIQAGTLKALDAATPILLGNAGSTFIQAGATLDVAGESLSIVGLEGNGVVTDSGGAATLGLSTGGLFTGVISGALSVTVTNGAEILIGNSTYSGTTTINAGAELNLGFHGSSSGSVAGAITDNGSLAIDRGDTFTLNNVSGSGSVATIGSGTTVLGSNLSYSGGTVIVASTLSVGNASALGSGGVTIDDGELLASATETISNQLTMSDNFTIAAAHSESLTTASAKVWTLNARAGEVISFGAAGQDGTVLFGDASGALINNGGTYTLNVAAGTLRAIDGGVSQLTANDLATVVQSGATLDVGGITTVMNGLQGSGHVGNGGTAVNLEVTGGNFAGTIGGPLTLLVVGNLTLSGTNTYAGGTTIDGGSELTLGNGGASGSVSSAAISDFGTLEFRLNATMVEGGLISGSGNLVQDGSGTTVLTAANNYSGGTLLAGGTLELQQPGAAGSGAITFVTGTTSTLKIDGTAMPTNAIAGVAAGDTFDLAGVAFDPSGHAAFGANVLAITENGKTYNLNFSPGQSFAAGQFFRLSSDGSGGTNVSLVNVPVPAGTTAAMTLQRGDGTLEIYDIGQNAILSGSPLGAVGPLNKVAGIGDFSGNPNESDLLERNSQNGAFEVYDISNNNVTKTAAMGQVGLEWTVGGFGDFSSRGESDMLMRNSNTGQFEVFDISNNAITSGVAMGQVGTEWQVAGCGDFSTRAGETDLLMRNSNTGQFEVFDITNNAISATAPMGQVGVEWQVAGFGDFSGNANETDMLMRNSNTGQFEIYDISNNAIYNAASMGQVGTEWQVAGFGPINGAGASDMLMRDRNNGAFEVFDIANNQLTTAAPMGQVGLEWSVAGIAADPPAGSMPANAQLAQAMASLAASGATVNVASPTGQMIEQSATPAPIAASPGLTAGETPVPVLAA